MPRLVLVTLAGAVTVLVIRRDPRLAERVNVRACAGLSRLAASVATFGAEVHDAMAAREHELRQAAGLPVRPAA